MLNDPIQNVGVDIQFQNDKIDVNTFEGQMGSGSYQVTGSARLQGFSLADYDLTAALNNPFITSKYFRGPVNGNLSLKSDRGRPVLAGRLRLENDTIDIPLVPDLQSSDLNLGLDLEVSAGNKVRLYNPYLYDIQVGGRVNFAGTITCWIRSGRPCSACRPRNNWC
jgi:translocation and assembly module TamB